MFVLDTNVISEMRKKKPHGGLIAWLESVPQNGLYMAAISFAEIQKGIELTRKLDPAKVEELTGWADQLAASAVILPADAVIFRQWAKLMHGKPDHHQADGMIAATALVHGLTVATRNVKDFKPFGVATLDPFKFGR